MRRITNHEANSCNKQLEIVVLDERGPGGVCHEYKVSWHNPHQDRIINIMIPFQSGPIKEFGINGLTHETLLAIVIDRLESLQCGPFACKENAMALADARGALQWLHKRTLDRYTRGVEGENKQ